jgi:hypothetical protein
MRSVSGRCAQSAFCEPLSSFTPRKFSTSELKPNCRSPSSRAASIVSKIAEGRKLMMFFQQAQIVIRRVKNEFATVEDVEQRVEIDGRERVNEFIAVGGADLDEADFFRDKREGCRLRYRARAIEQFGVSATTPRVLHHYQSRQCKSGKWLAKRKDFAASFKRL